MQGHAPKCEQCNSELAHKAADQLYKVSTPCLDNHPIKTTSLGISWRSMRDKFFELYRHACIVVVWHAKILWTVNHLTRSVTKCNSNMRSARLISYIHILQNTNRVVILATKPVIAHWVYFKVRTSKETWQSLGLRQVVCCACSDVVNVLHADQVSMETCLP